jgi:hypothetical protein
LNGGLTATELNAAEDLLQQRLQPVLSALGVSASIDLLRTAFDTDHEGLDAALVSDRTEAALKARELGVA